MHSKTVHFLANLIDQHVDNNPGSPAISDGENDLLYEDLKYYSDLIACRLNETMSSDSKIVMVMVEKSSWVAVCALAIFKANLIYLPVDPNSPKERLRYIMDDSKPCVIITEKEMQGLVGSVVMNAVNVYCLDELISDSMEFLSAAGGVSSVQSISPLDPAYCIYTSGSTGRPKGVLISHRSVLSFFEALNENLDLTPDSRFLSFSPFHFDASMIDVFHSLYRGGHVHIYRGFIDSEDIIKKIDSLGITHFSAFGPLLRIITESSDIEGFKFLFLKRIVVGAEIPDKNSIQSWISHKPNIKVINAYGPSETTVAVTAHVIDRSNVNVEGFYPIGKPLSGNVVKIINDTGGVIVDSRINGELVVGGPQVFVGYLNNKEKTQSATVRIDGEICYKTGDICSYLPDGSILYKGRVDDEVKISGFRVSLNEVKKSVEMLSYVKSAEAFSFQADSGEKYIIVAIKGEEELPENIEKTTQTELRSYIPAYMIPRRIYLLDEFPITANGKTDRKSLISLIRSMDAPNESEKEELA